MSKATKSGIAALFAAAITIVSPAYGVPGWATAAGSTSHSSYECMKSAAAAIKYVTGDEPTTEPDAKKSGNKAAKVRGFTSDSAIFVYCYPNLKKVCDIGVAADYSILVFSDKGKGVAGELRNKVNNAFKESKSVCID